MNYKRLFIYIFLCLLPIFSMADDVVRIDVSHPLKTRQTDSIVVSYVNGLITVDNRHRTGQWKFVFTGTDRASALLYRGHTKTQMTLCSVEISQLFIEDKKHCSILLPKNTVTRIAEGGDTLHRAMLFASGDLTIKGEGTLLIDATKDGMKGIYGKKDIHVKGGPVVTVHTSGNNLGVKPDMGPFGGGGFPDMENGEFPDFEHREFPDSMFMRDHHGFSPDSMFMRDHHGFSPDSMFMRVHHGFSPDSMFMRDHPHPDFSGMGDGEFRPDSMMSGGPMMGGGPMKQKYYNSTKGIKALGRILVEGGIITVSTRTAGAEGIEGKKGVTLAGGRVDVEAQDDGVNSGGMIIFSGAEVKVVSRGNDAVDSNSREKGSITISDGSVFACSLIGPPEEGLDCDESPIVLTGGIVLSMGGSMGPDGSSPTRDTATQPFDRLRNISVRKGQMAQLVTDDGLVVYSVQMPSSTVFTNVLISAGQKVSLKIKP